MDDSRLLWIRERLLDYFNETDPVLFYDLLERDNGRARNILRQYLDKDLSDSQSSERGILYFYKTFFEKIVEEEIMVSEAVLPVEKIKEQVQPVIVLKKKPKKKGGKKKKAEDKDGAEEEEGDDVAEEADEPEVTEAIEQSEPVEAEDSKKSAKKKKVPEKKEKSSPRTAVETPGPPETDSPEFVLVPKIIQKVVQAPELHIAEGKIPGDSSPFLVYFIRQTLTPIPMVENYSQAQATLPNHFLIGVTNGRLMSNFGLILKKDVVPAVKTQFKDPETILSRFAKPFEHSLDEMKEENDATVFAKYTPPSMYRRMSSKKLTRAIQPTGVTSAKLGLFKTSKYLEKVVETMNCQWDEPLNLEMPKFDVNNIVKDESYDDNMKNLQQVTKTWDKLLSSTLATCKNKEPPNEDPLAEIDFWIDRAAELLTLNEQFQKPTVKKILEIRMDLDKISTTILLQKIEQLGNFLWESQENVQVLSTITRYLKIVSLSDSFRDVSDCLPGLIEALRMIWNLSSHYNTDKAMTALMAKVSWVLCQKVSRNIKSESMFKQPLAHIIAETRDAMDMLRNWRSIYFQKRLEIEHADSGERWEFDKVKLFAETDYIASVLKDLYDIMRVVEQFLAVLGDDFKGVVKDPSQLDTIIKSVENLLLGIEMTDFDIYKPVSRDSWQAVVETFYKDVKILEKQVKFFIDQAFKMLRNSDDTLKLLLSFKNTDTRPLIKEQLLTKFDVLLQELLKEINETCDDFNRAKKKPPIFGYHPPESGAIFWSRRLFKNIQKPVLRFKEIPECDASPFKKEAFSEYLNLGRQMKDYEETRFQNWCKNVAPICSSVLSAHLFKIEKLDAGLFIGHRKQSVVQSARTSSTLPSKCSHRTENEFILSEKNLKLAVGLSQDIFDIIEESQHMEYMGFNVPKIIRSVALQKDRLHGDLVAVKTLLEDYDQTLERITPEQLQLLHDYVLRVQKHMLAGESRLNWKCLDIKGFVDTSSVALKHLKHAIDQIYDIEQKILEEISILSRKNLFPYKLQDEKVCVKMCAEFFNEVDRNRSTVFGEMLSVFKRIGPILMKLESLILHKNTGRAPYMKLVYEYWDRKFYDTFIQVVRRNLMDFEKSLNEKVILFDASVVLSAPLVLLDPTPENLHNSIDKSSQDCVYRFRFFPRWEKDSCMLSESSMSQPLVRSFVENIEKNTVEILQKIQHTAVLLSKDCEKCLARWEDYRKLWELDAKPVCQSFASKFPTLSDYHEEFMEYTSIEMDLAELPTWEKVRSIRINFTPMMQAIQNLCTTWKKSLADLLADKTKISMLEFEEMIQKFSTKLENKLDGLDDLKQVLQTISTIQNLTISSEIKYKDFQEVYHMFKIHKIQANEDEVQMCERVETGWQQLYISSLHKSHDIEPIKEKFAAKSLQEIAMFSDSIKNFVTEYWETGPGKIEGDLKTGLVIMKKFSERFCSYEKTREELAIAETLFSLPNADYSEYVKLKTHFDSLSTLFSVYESLILFQHSSSKHLWVAANLPTMTETIETFTKNYHKLEANVRTSSVGTAVEQILKEFKTEVHLMVALKSDSLVERHWHILMEKTEVKFDLSVDKFSLQDLFAMELYRCPGAVEEVIASAEKEMIIEISLKEIAASWQKATFLTPPHFLGSEQRGYVLEAVEEICQTIEDHSVSLQAMSASKFVGPFMAIVQKLEKMLALFGHVIHEWLGVQKKWIYLENIFIAGDVASQLPDEARKFEEIDKTFRRIMTETWKRPHVKDACEVEGRLSEMQSLAMGLEECQKSLTDYLQVKRNEFPRFFFISDEELLAFLGSSDPNSIQPYVAKIFDNVSALKLETNSLGQSIVTALISSEGERMDLENTVLAEGKVDTWMGAVVNEMRESIRFQTKKSIYIYGTVRQPRSEWVNEVLGMVCLAAHQVWWTAECEEHFREIVDGQENAMKKYLETLNKELEALVGIIQGSLGKIQRRKFNSLLILDVHNRDIAKGFVKAGTSDRTAFEWVSQLRYYWAKTDLKIQQCSGEFQHGYEYLGLSGRLVITPLTERIFLTVTQALAMQLGCSPTGPSCTGKTETVKDLSKALGLLCLVTYCGRSMDSNSIGKILNGLCQCGAWGCFDELTRIDTSVLSVISSQLQSIRHALVLKLRQFNFNGMEIKMDQKVGIFITLNPGHSGRAELSESIKALFRPVACVEPDTEMICFIMLLSEGFTHAKKLAKKVTVFYKMCRELLSRQPHYNFGIRTIKALLAESGEFKRESPKSNEEMILMRALSDMSMSTLVQDDIPIFFGIIKDLFPGVECDPFSDKDFLAALDEARLNENLEFIPQQLQKIEQVYEATRTRHATMIVGPTGGGKSVILLLLRSALNILGIPATYSFLNPKGSTVDQLYGTLDPCTGDWKDGILSRIFRDINQGVVLDGFHNIVFDGDVDAVWVENLNSVMDDNKLLNLANGERIALKKHCRLLFEVGDLNHASPATVSRVGVVYVDPNRMDTKALWKKWLKTQENAEVLENLFEKYVDELAVVSSRLQQMVSRSKLNLISQLCDVLDATLPRKSPFEEDEDDDDLADILECIFIQALVFSFGATILLEERPKFDDALKNLSGLAVVEASPSDKPGLKSLPNGMIFDYFVNIKEKCWVAWSWVALAYVHDRKIKFGEILVPTMDTIRAETILGWFLDTEKPFVLVGKGGTLKTAVVNEFLRKLPVKARKLKVNFSAGTTASILRRSIESAVEKRTKKMFGPPMGTKLVTFLDDLNMPAVNEYGTQEPIAFLKYLVEYGGFYDVHKDFSLVTLTSTYFIGAMGPPGGGRAELDPRFLSKCGVFNMTMPSDDNISYIFSAIVSAHVSIFAEPIQKLIPALISATLEILKSLKAHLPPTPAKFHYDFTPRDLSRVCSGLCQTLPTIFKTPATFIRAWRNELMRVFTDKLIDSPDIDFAKTTIDEQVKDIMGEDSHAVLRDPLLFGDFRNACREQTERNYEDLLDYDAVYFLFKEILEDYQEVSELRMVLFEHIIEHLTRIHRVLRLNRGHIMIVGVGGSGKRTMTKLAAYAAGYNYFEIPYSRNYTLAQFHRDIKRLYKIIGVENKPTVFLFTEAQVFEEGFLETVNGMLSVGVVASLFVGEEKEEIIRFVRTDAEQAGVSAKDGIWEFFCARCNENLHVVLSMSPVGDHLRSWCRKFPSLVKHTAVDWFLPWPKEALVSVANAYLSENPDVPEHFRSDVVSHMVHVHGSMEKYADQFLQETRRKNHVTPKQFLSFIELYLQQLKEKNTFISSQKSSLESGVRKIAQSRLQLEELGGKLAVQKATEQAKTSACEELMTVIEVATDKVNLKNVTASKKRKDIEEYDRQIKIEEKECEEILENAWPVLEAAKEALNDLQEADITVILSFTTPPQAVQIVCECVLYLLGVKDVSWQSAKTIMAEPNFTQDLRGLDCEQITLTQLRLCKSQAKNLPPDLKASSTAAHELMMFVQAVLGYCAVFREVKPKKERVEQLRKDKIHALEVMKRLHDEIDEIKLQLSALEVRYEQATKEKTLLQEETNLVQARFEAAGKLMSGLCHEDNVWNIQLKNLELDRDYIIGDCLLSAAFLSYTGPFSYEFRIRMVHNDWAETLRNLGIPSIHGCGVESFLCDEVEISKWHTEGLPSDGFSVQNGVLAVCGSKFPFFIDPQMRAVNWIRKREQNVLKSTSFADSDYLKVLQTAIQCGFPLLIENIENFIDPIIENVLDKNFVFRNGRTTVVLGGNVIDVHPNFRLYLSSKLSNPDVRPGIYAKATVINCCITTDGLEDQLLSVLVKSEKPSLEEASEKLKQDTFNLKSTLKSLEASILKELTNASGNLLDNEAQVTAMETAKFSVSEISQKLLDGIEIARDIESERNVFRSVANRGSILYFALLDMATVSPMYQFSLDAFLKVFVSSVATPTPSDVLGERLSKLSRVLTSQVYKFGCLGFFKKHQLLFSFRLASELDLNEQKITQTEIDFCVSSPLSVEASKSVIAWLSDEKWSCVSSLQSGLPKIFGNLMSSLGDSEKQWENWFNSENPELTPVPGHPDLTPFQTILLIRCFRPDRVVRATVEYVKSSLGTEFVMSPDVCIEEILENSSPMMPVIFVLSSGSDPTNSLLKLAEKFGMAGGRFKHCALGEGQEDISLTLLKTALKQGQWLLVQSCHLLLETVRRIEEILVKSVSPHPDFRLWLTTHPSANFPVGLLQKSLKVVIEPPDGLKLNMKHTFLKIGSTIFDTCMHPKFKPMAFGLAFFHAVLQERRKFGTLGWNLAYDFSDMDFTVSLEILKTYLNEATSDADSIPWRCLKFLICEIVYGGRVIDNFDLRIVKTLADEYFGDFIFDHHQPFHFYRDSEFLYTVPKTEDFQTFVDYLETMPFTDKPNLFGLDRNAEIAYYTKHAQEIWSHLADMQPLNGVHEDVSREEVIFSICSDILSKTPEQFNIESTRKRFEMTLTPRVIVLLQELERFNVLTSEMKNSMNLLQKALRGEVEMNTKLEKMSLSLFCCQLPDAWRKLAPETCKNLAGWIEHFQKRCEQYSEWVQRGEPVVIWLSGLHVPQSYLTALVQSACRENGWPLGKCELYTAVSEFETADDVEQRLIQGTYVHGLFLEGARWDKTSLKPALPRVLFEKLPVLKVVPIKSGNRQQLNILRTPVYTTPNRRNTRGSGLAFEADLAIAENENHWIVRGVCLLLNTE